MHTHTKHISRAMLTAIVTLIAALALTYSPTTAHAHHGVPGEPVPLAHARDAFHVRACDAFRYDGISPSREVCAELLRATHTVSVENRDPATRRWVSSPALLKLLRKESGYSPNAVNPTSGACGLGQMLPCDKYGPGSCWPAVRKQARCVVRYILGRYRTPARAWHFWQYTSVALTGNHWY